MNVEIVDDSQVIVRVSGDVELPHVDKLRSVIEDAAKKAADGFIIDLTDVHYIDSAGISALVFAYRRICPSGGKLAVVVADKNVYRIITLTRLHTLPGISLHENVSEAQNLLESEVVSR